MKQDRVNTALDRGVEKIYPTRDTLFQRLTDTTPLKIYQGFDPTASTLHIGHMVGLRKLRQFHDLGHHVIFLVGDFTALIGDPSGKDTGRPQLSRDAIKKNLAAYREQAGRILDFRRKENPVTIKFNATWLHRLSPEEILTLARHFTVQQLIERDMFQLRLKKGRPIAVSEFLYPIFQGYDSVAMDVDLEIGATDQTFNMLAGRTLLSAMRKKEKFVLTTKLLQSASGKKMGKTEGNMIALTETPRDMYGKIMAMPDDFLPSLLELLTDFPVPETIVDPMATKKSVAYNIVRQVHGVSGAESAQQEFERVVQGRGIPTQTTKIKTQSSIRLHDLATLIGKSTSHTKRLLAQQSISINGKKIANLETVFLKPGDILRVGKHRFFEVTK